MPQHPTQEVHSVDERVPSARCSTPVFVPGGAGLAMPHTVAASRRILANTDYKTNLNNLCIIAISIGAGMIALFESGLVRAAVCSVPRNTISGGKGDATKAIKAAKAAEAR